MCMQTCGPLVKLVYKIRKLLICRDLVNRLEDHSIYFLNDKLNELILLSELFLHTSMFQNFLCKLWLFPPIWNLLDDKPSERIHPIPVAK